MSKLFIAFWMATAFAAAQPAAPASFEVASIKVHPEPVTASADPSVRGSRMMGTASTLLDLITTAYGVKYDQISGAPGWASAVHYDVNAKAEGEEPITKDQAKQMLQNLLADRFRLKIHRENREVPVYALVVGKGGPKMKVSTADAPGNNFTRSSAAGMHMEMTHGTMEALARQLSSSAGRPVHDRTGLTGYYAYQLDWLPPGRTPDPNSDTPSIFTALQEQLGLKLEPSKGAVEMLIIDSAERPSEN
jgi:uncharacterized protein (TIGR03435 family)